MLGQIRTPTSWREKEGTSVCVTLVCYSFLSPFPAFFVFFHFSSGMIRSRDTDEQEDKSPYTEDQVHTSRCGNILETYLVYIHTNY
jgi:hypothetical protein